MFAEIHSHFLCGMDDGAQNEQQMQEMIRIAAKNKVSRLIATSHAYVDEHRFDLEKYARMIDSARRFCEMENLPIKIYTGAEIFYSEFVPNQLVNGMLPTLAGTRNVLLEFGGAVKGERLIDAVQSIGNIGYNAVIAHVERYDCILKDMDLVHELVDRCDAALQVNSSLFVFKQSMKMKRWCDEVVEERLVTLVSSDAHNTTSRKCRMSECYEILCHKYGRETALDLCTNNARRLLGWKTI